MSHYAQNTGRHCMAVLILSALAKRLRACNLPTQREAKAKGKQAGMSLFAERCIVTCDDGITSIEGKPIAEWAKVGITEAQAKAVMQDSGVLKKCTWEQLWRAYKSQ